MINSIIVYVLWNVAVVQIGQIYCLGIVGKVFYFFYRTKYGIKNIEYKKMKILTKLKIYLDY